jgi:hypothetical protein
MDRSTILDMLNHLTSAQRRLEAIIMASNALPNNHRDVMQVLACDCGETIGLVEDALQRFMPPAVSEEVL